jgi:hypothetical protein
LFFSLNSRKICTNFVQISYEYYFKFFSLTFKICRGRRFEDAGVRAASPNKGCSAGRRPYRRLLREAGEDALSKAPL